MDFSQNSCPHVILCSPMLAVRHKCARQMTITIRAHCGPIFFINFILSLPASTLHSMFQIRKSFLLCSDWMRRNMKSIPHSSLGVGIADLIVRVQCTQRKHIVLIIISVPTLRYIYEFLDYVEWMNPVCIRSHEIINFLSTMYGSSFIGFRNGSNQSSVFWFDLWNQCNMFFSSIGSTWQFLI